MKTKHLDSALVLDAWPALDVAPSDDFVGRVLAAYDAPRAIRAPLRMWPIYACAVVIAGLLAPLVGTPLSSSNATSALLVAHAPDLDLGLQTD